MLKTLFAHPAMATIPPQLSETFPLSLHPEYSSMESIEPYPALPPWLATSLGVAFGAAALLCGTWGQSPSTAALLVMPTMMFTATGGFLGAIKYIPPQRQSVFIDGKDLVVASSLLFHHESARYDLSWSRVATSHRTNIMGEKELVVQIKLGSKATEIGSFLTEDRKRDVLQSLQTEINLWRKQGGLFVDPFPEP